MTLQILILLGGLALILFGANWLVDGSSSIAKKFGISEFVIGLTIVGIGTSTPEMVVSFLSAFQGKSRHGYRQHCRLEHIQHPHDPRCYSLDRSVDHHKE